MALELGDHVWYWNDRVTQDMNIPRADWFPQSNPADPNDYSGHGTEIFNYVFHDSNVVLRGQPQLRHGAGSFAWLDNNPGNLTGRQGGPDFGQYSGKFNWHNFLIFPSHDAGFGAIATLLRSSSYATLSILDAFKKYAPA